jgi:hypothetical protein
MQGILQRINRNNMRIVIIISKVIILLSLIGIIYAVYQMSNLK